MRLFLSLSFLLLALNLFAQQQPAPESGAVLTGVVTDAKTKEPLYGATVVLVGTYKGGTTNLEGRFRIAGIKGGDYTVKVSYLGYVERVYTGVRIGKDGTTTLDVPLAEQVSTTQTVEIIGERQMVDLESGKSEVRITAADIGEMAVRNVQDVVALQAGVTQTPDGLQIRGGRTYETTYIVDGISAADPLAGTGFGANVSSASISDLSLVTGGASAEFNSTSGVVVTRVKEGGDRLQVFGNWQRDNLFYNRHPKTGWNTDVVDLAIGGPLPFTNKKLRFFTSINAQLTDTYFRLMADQLYSSIMPNDKFWAPRQDNAWTHTAKLSYELNPRTKISLLNQHSLAINQSTRTLQVIGFDAIMVPGLQWAFANNLDNATTYTHRTNLTAFNLNRKLNTQWSMDVTLGRLFTNMRADANGRPFRDSSANQIYDPASIVTGRVDVYRPGQIPGGINFVLPGNGLVNNGGISTLWHDHYVEEYTVKYKFNYLSTNKMHFVTFGQEHKEQKLQWVDVTSPWVGAPIKLADGTFTPSRSIGTSNDVWTVSPNQGNFFVQDEIRYKGIIATIGMRLDYWAPGREADDLVANQRTPIPQDVRDDYARQTFKFIDGRQYKARLLPRLNVSFPVTENNVMYFNYSHSMRLPHPRFIYAGLDSVYQNRSVLSDLGNPAINPEVSVSYEVGIKSQLSRDFGVTLTAFYKDYFDYIVTRSRTVQDYSGQLVEKSFSINSDYARVRGVELGLNYRFTKSLRAMANIAYQAASGKSNTAAESRLQIRQSGTVDLTKEQPLAWDRPWDLKGSLIFTPDNSWKLGDFSLEGFRVFLTTTWKSGLRYTSAVYRGNTVEGRPIYQVREDVRNDKLGSPWAWTDLKITRDFLIRSSPSKQAISLSLEVRNLFNNINAQIVNPVTGRGYDPGDPVTLDTRDPRYPSPQDSGTPPWNPARYMQPRQIIYGISFNF